MKRMKTRWGRLTVNLAVELLVIPPCFLFSIGIECKKTTGWTRSKTRPEVKELNFLAANLESDTKRVIHEHNLVSGDMSKAPSA